MDIDEFYDALVNRCLLFVPSGTVDAYKADAHWGLFKYIFAQGTEMQLYIIRDGKTYNAQGEKVE